MYSFHVTPIFPLLICLLPCFIFSHFPYLFTTFNPISSFLICVIFYTFICLNFFYLFMLIYLLFYKMLIRYHFPIEMLSVYCFDNWHSAHISPNWDPLLISFFVMLCLCTSHNYSNSIQIPIIESRHMRGRNG